MLRNGYRVMARLIARTYVKLSFRSYQVMSFLIRKHGANGQFVSIWTMPSLAIQKGRSNASTTASSKGCPSAIFARYCTEWFSEAVSNACELTKVRHLKSYKKMYRLVNNYMLELFVLHFRKHIVLLNCLLVNVTASP
jgi:hypothetical protein